MMWNHVQPCHDTSALNALSDSVVVVQCSYVDVQIFLSTLRTAINTEGDIGGQDSRMAQSVDGLFATFNELHEVLNRPVLQYAVLNSFLVCALGRKALSTRLAQTVKVMTEVLHSLLSAALQIVMLSLACRFTETINKLCLDTGSNFYD